MTRTMYVVIASMLAVLACSDPRPQTFLWEEGFEELCDDAPCGWSETAGPEGSARWAVTSLHPGEHALVLDGTDIEVRGPSGDVEAVLFSFSTLEARVVGRCDAGASLEVSVGLAEIASDGVTVLRLDETRPAPLSLADEWDAGPTSTTLTARTALTDGGITGLSTNLRITTVIITKRGPGICEIADMAIDDVGMTELSSGTHC